MPKFVYTVALLTLLPLGILIYIVGWVGTVSYPYIFLLLIALQFFLTGLLSLILFFIFWKLKKEETDPRQIYRKTLKIGMYAALIVTMIMFLRGFKLESPVNIILFTAFYLVLGYQLFFYGRKEH